MDSRYPLGLKFSIIDRAIKRKLDGRAEELGLTGVQLRVLGEISLLQSIGVDEISQRSLENIEMVSHPAMTGIIQRLEAKGYVRCAPGSRDRRYKRIECTDRVQDLHKVLAEHDDTVIDEMCSGFSEEELRQLMDLTDRMLENVR